MMERDFTDECIADLSQKKQAQATKDELRRYFCGRCKNLGCSQITTGPADPMGARARSQEQRLLHPEAADPRLPKYLPITQNDFGDAREAAEAWNPRRKIADFADQQVDPALMMPARSGRAPLRDLPVQANTAVEPRRQQSMSHDPWNPQTGEVVVKSGATIRLGGSGGSR